MVVASAGLINATAVLLAAYPSGAINAIINHVPEKEPSILFVEKTIITTPASPKAKPLVESQLNFSSFARNANK